MSSTILMVVSLVTCYNTGELYNVDGSLKGVTGSKHHHYQNQDGGNKNISSLSRVGGGKEKGFSLDSVED